MAAPAAVCFVVYPGDCVTHAQYVCACVCVCVCVLCHVQAPEYVLVQSARGGVDLWHDGGRHQRSAGRGVHLSQPRVFAVCTTLPPRVAATCSGYISSCVPQVGIAVADRCVVSSCEATAANPATQTWQKRPVRDCWTQTKRSCRPGKWLDHLRASLG